MIWVLIDSLKDRMCKIKHWFRAFVCKDVYYEVNCTVSSIERKCYRIKDKNRFVHLSRNCEWWNCPKNKNLKGEENAGEKETREAEERHGSVDM